MRQRLKRDLDRVLAECDYKERSQNDPIRFPARYRDQADIEVAGLISSALAYGRVELFTAVLEKLFAPMGGHPAEFVRSFSPKRHARLFAGLNYRFNKTDDLMALILMVKRALGERGTLEDAFMAGYAPAHEDIGPALAGFVKELLLADTSSVYGRDIRPPGLLQLLPSPVAGGASKRLCLYLRWMVRTGRPDFGLWKGVPPSRLVIPLDTHIARISRCLGLTGRKSSDWKTAVEITDSLKEFSPDDPLIYDFALCHMGISGACNPKACGACGLGRG